MSNKRVAVRLVAEGGRQVKAEFQGVGDSGEREFGRIERAADSVGAVVTRVMGILGAAISIRQIVTYADTWTDLRSRVDLASGSQERGAAVMERLNQMARRTYSSLEQTTESYLANNTALRDLGMTTRESLDFTEALNNALVVSGARQQRAEQISNALSQAMALGQLRGQQLNTVIQNGGRVAELLAAELGVTGNELRGLGAQGRITGDVIRRALVGNLELLREEADNMPETIGDAFTLMGNAALTLVGTFDTLLGASGGVAQGIIFLADNLQQVASYGIALAGFMAGRWVASMIAAQVKALGLSGALIALRNSIIRASIIGALIVGAGEMVHWFSRLVQGAGGFGAALGLLRDVAIEVWDRIKAGTIGLGAAMAAIWYDLKADAADAMAKTVDWVVWGGNRYIGVYRGAYEAIKSIWGLLPGAIGDFAYQAANTLIGGVELMLNAVVERINSFVTGLNLALSYLPDWVTGGTPIEIGTIARLDLGRIENQFEGAAAQAGAAAREAFLREFNTDTFAAPDFGLEEIARASRQTAQEFREAYQDIFAGVTLPLESWEALRQAMVAAGEDGGDALDDSADAARRLAEQLARGGGAARQAGEDSKAGADQARTGWLAAAEAVRKYAEETMDLAAQIGQGIVGAFRSAENAVADFVRTGKFDFSSFVTSILADMARIAARRFILGPLANALGGIFQGWGAAGIGKAGASIAIPSFDGGGHTGYGARVGGLDGRGGMLAMVHPRERIIDETRGGRRGGDMAPVVVNIQARDAQSFRQSRAQLAADVQRAVAMGRRVM